MENGTEKQRGFTLWFTGLSGAGKTTISEIVEKEIKDRGLQVEVLDGDIVRTNLSKGLTFSRDDRNVNVLRIGFVANLLTRNGVAVIVSAISPYKEARDQVRRRIIDFVEVFVDVPIEVAAERDVKGLYKKAYRRGDRAVHRRLRPLRASRGPRPRPQDRRRDGGGEREEGNREARVLRLPVVPIPRHRVQLELPLARPAREPAAHRAGALAYSAGGCDALRPLRKDK